LQDILEKELKNERANKANLEKKLTGHISETENKLEEKNKENSHIKKHVKDLEEQLEGFKLQLQQLLHITESSNTRARLAIFSFFSHFFQAIRSSLRVDDS
jgi:septal ring factor EnvC (AmiA/AmiB activator)